MRSSKAPVAPTHPPQLDRSDMSMRLATRAQAEALISRYTTFLFDCDGVLWQGTHLLPQSKETLEYLRGLGKRLIFVTNNSTKSRQAYSKKFRDLGLDVKPTEIFGSSYSSAVYLDKVAKMPKDRKVLVVGEKGLEEELQEVGYTTVGGTDPSFVTAEFDESRVVRDPSIGCVLSGLDTKINYFKLAYAQQQLLDPQVIFLATNIDSTFPSHGKILPGAGTIIQAVATCSGRTPEAALGKPSKSMMDCIKAAYDLDPETSIMVGDRLNTDMEFGHSGGMSTLFVLSGIDNEERMAKSPVTPTFYADNLGSLYRLVHN